ncbi:xylulokinase [Salibacterium qingdaonense]|uniref:Xylulose kinase n=1 Tax=Salibacterium qingdaonense TaxID=266892 RepID=A0A1I4P629_9BACI|nr:xylulokinase [Salibacterium qingdaonense]SFM23268.1 xylulokinase [Salibacterium qingdaonense]
MDYFIGVDLGTSAVKAMLVSEQGEVSDEVAKPLSLMQPQNGFSEQNPEEWAEQTTRALKELIERFPHDAASIKGLSFSGQMHSLVLLDKQNDVLRNAILWNDTRTTAQCREIEDVLGKERLLDMTKNPAVEGVTLSKMLWVKEHEPEIWEQAATFLLPKDYVRYKLTGRIHMDYSDAAGTLLLDIVERTWSRDMCEAFEIDPSFCPPLLEATDPIGPVTEEISERTGVSRETQVIAGGADNACGGVGSGILQEGRTLCSVGTSGVVLSYEEDGSKDFGGSVHYFNHAAPDAYYAMGVTLSAGNSLRWFQDVFAPGESMDEMVEGVEEIPPGAGGLLFTPYLDGERTPHADADIRASFIGMDSSHGRKDFVRSVMEGITFSLKESVDIIRNHGREISSIVSIGGGAKNETWLQMQADIFEADVIKLKSEQGPGVGAAMLAAYGSGAFSSLQECSEVFLQVDRVFYPDAERRETYRALYGLYQNVYEQTKELNNRLKEFRT